MSNGQRTTATVLALHGFTLGGAMFADVAARLEAGVSAPDLPGHAGRDSAGTSWDAAISEIISTARRLSPHVIVGYSMGGRLALNAALAEPDIATGLVLISTSLGIADGAERSQRLAADVATADSLTDDRRAEGFLRSFHGRPIVRATRSTIELEPIRLTMTRSGLAGALRGMGQGSQPYVGDRLGELAMPVTWVAGAEDEKYVRIAQHAHAANPHGTLMIVPESGHNVVAERPDAVAAAITSALDG